MRRRSRVVVTDGAKVDLDEIHEYIATHDAPAKAEHVLDKVGEAMASLETFPQRGALTKELRGLGDRQFRETYFKPYRIIYGVEDGTVVVYLIADGRCDMQTLLQKRLLRP